jgi:hypothetical protein
MTEFRVGASGYRISKEDVEAWEAEAFPNLQDWLRWTADRIDSERLQHQGLHADETTWVVVQTLMACTVLVLRCAAGLCR